MQPAACCAAPHAFPVTTACCVPCTTKLGTVLRSCAQQSTTTSLSWFSPALLKQLSFQASHCPVQLFSCRAFKLGIFHCAFAAMKQLIILSCQAAAVPIRATVTVCSLLWARHHAERHMSLTLCLSACSREWPLPRSLQSSTRRASTRASNPSRPSTTLERCAPAADPTPGLGQPITVWAPSVPDVLGLLLDLKTAAGCDKLLCTLGCPLQPSIVQRCAMRNHQHAATGHCCTLLSHLWSLFTVVACTASSISPIQHSLDGMSRGCVDSFCPRLAVLHVLQVNKVRECPQEPSVLVTHTDAPELYVWSTERQHNRQGDTVSGAGGCDHRSNQIPAGTGSSVGSKRARWSTLGGTQPLRLSKPCKANCSCQDVPCPVRLACLQENRRVLAVCARPSWSMLDVQLLWLCNPPQGHPPSPGCVLAPHEPHGRAQL